MLSPKHTSDTSSFTYFDFIDDKPIKYMTIIVYLFFIFIIIGSILLGVYI